jgi:hypothetical protein
LSQVKHPIENKLHPISLSSKRVFKYFFSVLTILQKYFEKWYFEILTNRQIINFVKTWEKIDGGIYTDSLLVTILWKQFIRKLFQVPTPNNISFIILQALIKFFIVESITRYLLANKKLFYRLFFHLEFHFLSFQIINLFQLKHKTQFFNID